MQKLFYFDIESFNIIAMRVINYPVKLVKISIRHRRAYFNFATLLQHLRYCVLYSPYGNLGLQIFLAIQRRCLNKALIVGLLSGNEQTIGGDCLSLLYLKEVAHPQLVTSHLFLV